MLEDLTKESFHPLIGDTFLLVSHEPPLELKLAEIEARWGRGPKREPFSLFFVGPADPLLPQRIYRLEHRSLGTLELFLVPVGREGAAIRYEAAFT